VNEVLAEAGVEAKATENGSDRDPALPLLYLPMTTIATLLRMLKNEILFQ